MEENKRPRLEPVVSQPGVIKKKTTWAKFKETFIAEDFKTVGSMAAKTVLVPAIKDIFWNIITYFTSSVLYGSGDRRPSGGYYSKQTSYPTSYITYGNSFSAQKQEPKREITPYDFYEITLPSRDEMESVRLTMLDVLDRYNFVSVGDYYDLTRVPCDNPSIWNYGWTSLNGVKTLQNFEGRYYLTLPKAYPLPR